MSNFSNSLIIERFKQVTNSRTDRELAEKLNLSASTLANWKNPTKTKPTLAELIFDYAERNNLDLNWLILGKELQDRDTAQQMALTAFNTLNDQQKIEAIAFMSGLGKSAGNLGSISQPDNATVHTIKGNHNNVAGRDIHLTKSN